MSPELKNKIKEVVDLAKVEFGERVISGMTYTIGDIYGGYDEEYITLDRLIEIVHATENDIEMIKELGDNDSYAFDDNYTIVKCMAEASNPGWRFELLRIIREWYETT